VTVARAAIVVALAEELEPYRRLIPDLIRADDGIWERYLTPDGSLAITRCDCGPIGAVAAAERTITTFHPDLLINTGSAGAHNPELLPGDIVVGARYVLLTDPLLPSGSLGLCWQSAPARVERGGVAAGVELVAAGLQAAAVTCAGAQPWADLAVWPVDAPPRRPLALAGTVGSADSWTLDAARIDRLWASAQSQSEDMESAYIAQVCALHGLPFLAIRCISNAERHAGTARMTRADVVQAIARAGELAARTACTLLQLLQ
jgi:adenosylhomocysteine nucleosidase